MPYFLPKTSHNIRQYLSEVEDKQFPEFAARHDQIMATSESHFQMLKDRVGGAGQEVSSWGKNAVEGIERNTGLKVGDVVRRGQEAAGKVRDELERKAPPASTQVERVGYVVEQKPVAELVRPVAADVAAASSSTASPAAAAAATVAPVVEPQPTEKKADKRMV